MTSAVFETLLPKDSDKYNYSVEEKISLYPVIYEGKKLFSPRVRSVCVSSVCV